MKKKKKLTVLRKKKLYVLLTIMTVIAGRQEANYILSIQIELEKMEVKKPVLVGAAGAAGWALKLTPCLWSPFRLAMQTVYLSNKNWIIQFTYICMFSQAP